MDVSQENRRRHNREAAQDVFKNSKTQQHLGEKKVRQRLHVDTYELDSSSDLSRLEFDREIIKQKNSFQNI